ncbi:transglutaminase TgpA family protein [Halorussus marinus]|uniref:transglutaminase TgpA family protein n=1 Tax=Halorussus marinus TaxID=2505976 RepID=UPI001FCEB65C|nr:transglutaminaseTgpA domain-containing protein [Halorussus marinus]
MSADAAVGRELELGDVAVPYHWLAVGSTGVLMATYLSVLYHVTDIVGGTAALTALVVATLVAATLAARHLPVSYAAALVVGLLGAGLGGYYLSVPSPYLVATSTGQILADNVALLTGLSVLRMTEVGAWALGVAPALSFGPWYLVLRRRYALAVAAGGVALTFFVLTGDAGSFVTLVGSLAAASALGFGTLARRGGTAAQVDAIAIALVAMVVVSSAISVVPGGTASPILPGGSAGPQTVEGSVVNNDERTNIVGSIELSPTVRFSVEAERRGYWRVGAYDRYDGDGWIRTGEATDYRAQSAPPGPSRTLDQTVTVEADRLGAMPAAWRPVRLRTGADNARVTSEGSFDPIGALREGEQYTVLSEVPDPSESELRTAGTDYPEEIAERYRQLPASSADRIRERTDEIAAGAETPYATAVAIENWLEANKAYSLDVDRPDGNVAESFIFDMERGYCTYYATAMVAMLRSQDVPARFAVGYTPGQRVAENEWVVRGLDSHAWVEVYFPEIGWVKFDPTPGGPRADTESQRVQQARERNVSNVDTDDSQNGTWTPTTTQPEDETGTETTDDGTGSENLTAVAESGPGQRPQLAPDREVGRTDSAPEIGVATTEAEDGAGDVPIRPPSPEEAALGGLVVVGLLAAARRTGALARLRRTAWLYWQPRRDPDTDVERAFARLEHLLADRFRERRPGETPREYLDAIRGIDRRAERVGEIYERVRYAGESDRLLADQAVALVDELVRERRGLGR